MHITTEEMSTEKRKPERDKDNKISLNIPLYGKTEMSPKSIMKGSKNSLLGRKHEFDLEQSFSKLCLSNDYQEERYDEDSDDSSVSDDENRKTLESNLSPKGPEKIRNATREDRKTRARPYAVSQTISTTLQSGGIIIPPSKSIFIQSPYQIPQTVEEFESPNDVFTSQDVEKVYKELNDYQIRLLDNSIDLISCQLDKEDKIDTSSQSSKTRDSDSCNSPDSSYGTMSPASIPPSPFSLHSPNPRVEKRLSESDSACESELAATELPFGRIDISKIPQLQLTNSKCIMPPPRQNHTIITTSRPVYNPQVLVPSLTPRPLRPDSIEVNEVGLEKPAAERMKEKKFLNPKIVPIEYISAIEETKDFFNHKASSLTEVQSKKSYLRGKLINLIREGPKNRHFYEQLYSKVKLYMSKSDSLMDILMGKDINGDSPLLVAATIRKDIPIVARLLADAIYTFMKASGKTSLDILKDIEDVEGNTILHYLASKGDSHAQVLCELLYSKAFNVNHKNAGSRTALHKAVENHPKVSSLASIKQLVKHGAWIQIQDLYGQTVLHLAVSYPQSDPQVLRALLTSSKAEEAVNIVDNDRNTPLHIAATRNDLPLEKQKEFISLLMLSKARHDIRNKDEKVALSLVPIERKEGMKNLLHRKI